MISAIVIPTDNSQPATLVEIDPHDGNAYNRVVGGHLEIVTIDRPEATVYLNGEGKLDKLPTNSRATALVWTHRSTMRGVDPIVGDVLVVGLADQDGDDLPAPDDLVQLLLHTERYRVQVQRYGFTRWEMATDTVYDDWFGAYVYGVNTALRHNEIEEVRVIPERSEELAYLIEQWYELGVKNPWIRHADDPVFTRDSFYECFTVNELAEQISRTNWTLGTAFFYRDLCFINQVEGGDEWLTIRHGIAFESMTLDPMIEEGKFPALIKRLLTASKEQCKELKY